MTPDRLEEIRRELDGDWSKFEGDLPVTDACRELLEEVERARRRGSLTPLSPHELDELRHALEDPRDEDFEGILYSARWLLGLHDRIAACLVHVAELREWLDSPEPGIGAYLDALVRLLDIIDPMADAEARLDLDGTRLGNSWALSLEERGTHVEATIRVGTPGSRALAGRLTLRPEEAEALRLALDALGAETQTPDRPPE